MNVVDDVTNPKESEPHTKISYQTFEELETFSEDVDLGVLVENIERKLNKDSDWLAQFEAVENLRRLNKFYPEVLKEVLKNLYKAIGKLTSSYRSNLSKNSIMLINEILNSQKDSKQQVVDFQAIKHFLNCILFQSSNMKGFIKSVALNCLENFANTKSFYNMSSIISLIEEISSKNQQSAENAFHLLEGIISNWDAEDMVENTVCSAWKLLFAQTLNLFHLKREPYSRRACKILKLLSNKLGDRFEKQLYLLDYSEAYKQKIYEMIKTATPKMKAKRHENIKEGIRRTR